MQILEYFPDLFTRFPQYSNLIPAPSFSYDAIQFIRIVKTKEVVNAYCEKFLDTCEDAIKDFDNPEKPVSLEELGEIKSALFEFYKESYYNKENADFRRFAIRAEDLIFQIFDYFVRHTDDQRELVNEAKFPYIASDEGERFREEILSCPSPFLLFAHVFFRDSSNHLVPSLLNPSNAEKIAKMYEDYFLHTMKINPPISISQNIHDPICILPFLQIMGDQTEQPFCKKVLDAIVENVSSLTPATLGLDAIDTDRLKVNIYLRGSLLTSISPIAYRELLGAFLMHFPHTESFTSKEDYSRLFYPGSFWSNILYLENSLRHIGSGDDPSRIKEINQQKTASLEEFSLQLFKKLDLQSLPIEIRIGIIRIFFPTQVSRIKVLIEMMESVPYNQMMKITDVLKDEFESALPGIRGGAPLASIKDYHSLEPLYLEMLQIFTDRGIREGRFRLDTQGGFIHYIQSIKNIFTRETEQTDAFLIKTVRRFTGFTPSIIGIKMRELILHHFFLIPKMNHEASIFAMECLAGKTFQEMDAEEAFQNLLSVLPEPSQWRDETLKSILNTKVSKKEQVELIMPALRKDNLSEKEVVEKEAKYDIEQYFINKTDIEEKADLLIWYYLKKPFTSKIYEKIKDALHLTEEQLREHINQLHPEERKVFTEKLLGEILFQFKEEWNEKVIPARLRLRNEVFLDAFQTPFLRKLMPLCYEVMEDELLDLSMQVQLFYRCFIHKASAERSDANLMKDVFEAMGAPMVKFGQILGQRIGNIPEDYRKVLKELEDRVATIDYLEALNLLEEALGVSPWEIFSEIQLTENAGAFKAILKGRLKKTGEEVAIKILKPDALSVTLRVINFLKRLNVQIQEVHKGEFGQIPDISFLLEDLETMMRRELDFNEEIKNQKELKTRYEKKGFFSSIRIKIPKTFPKLCRKNVIVESWIEGVRFDSSRLKDETGLSTKKAERIASKTVRGQIIRYHEWHGDPHPGNILFGRDEKGVFMTFLDSALFGRLTSQEFNAFIEILAYLEKGNVEEASKLMRSFCFNENSSSDYKALEAKLKEGIEGLTQRDFRTVMDFLIKFFLFDVNKSGYRLKFDFFILAKTITTVEKYYEETKTWSSDLEQRYIFSALRLKQWFMRRMPAIRDRLPFGAAKLIRTNI